MEQKKSKLTAEAVDYLNNVSTYVGASKTSTLIGKTFNIISLNIRDVLDKQAITKEIEKNPKLDFMKNDTFVFRGTLKVRFTDKTETVVYINNPLLASLKKAKAIEFNLVDGDIIYTIDPRAVKLSAEKAEIIGNTTTEATTKL